MLTHHPHHLQTNIHQNHCWRNSRGRRRREDDDCCWKQQTHFSRNSRSLASASPTQLNVFSPSRYMHATFRSAMNAFQISSAAQSSSVAMFQLSTAFLLGGLFFSVFFPRLISWASLGIIQAMRRHKMMMRRRNQMPKSRSVELKQRRIKFKTVHKKSLGVVQYVANKLSGLSFQTLLQRGLEDALEQVENPNIQSIDLQSFETCSAPQVKKGRFYEEIDNAMVFDLDMDWRDFADARMNITTRRLGMEIPVVMHILRITGTMRVILTPLKAEPPGFGAVLFSFVNIPRIDLQVEVGGRHITRVPWLKEALIVALQGILEKKMVWPRRIVNPTFHPNVNSSLVEETTLAELELDDPFLSAESGLVSDSKQSIKASNPQQQSQERMTGENSKGNETTLLDEWRQTLRNNENVNVNATNFPIVEPILKLADQSKEEMLHNFVDEKNESQDTDEKWGEALMKSIERLQSVAEDNIAGDKDHNSNWASWENLVDGLLRSFENDSEEDPPQTRSSTSSVEEKKEEDKDKETVVDSRRSK